MADAETLAFTANFALGLFLIFLAAVILRTSPQRGARGWLAIFMVLVGLNYALDVVSEYTVHASLVRLIALVPVLLDPPVLLLFALALVHGPPRRATTAALLAPAALYALAFTLRPPASPYLSHWAYGELYAVELVVYYVPAFALLVRQYVHEQGPLARDRMAVIVLAAGVVVLPRLPLIAYDLGYFALGREAGRVTSVIVLVGLLALVALATAALTLPRVPAPNRAHVRRTAVRLAAFLAIVAGVWALVLLPGLVQVAGLAYAIRWYLFAFILAEGLDRYDLLGLPEGFQAPVRGALTVTLVVLAVAQVAGLFATIPDTSTSVALVSAMATVALGSAAVALGRRGVPGARPELAWRRLTVYRAHVELGASQARLEALRERLGIRDAEARDVHELVALERAVPAEARSAELVEGETVLGRYEVQGFLGVGAFGRTFVAWDHVTKRRVVLKELLGAWRGDPTALAHFRREAELAMTVEHPNLVAFHGLETLGSGHLLVLDYVPGRSVRDRLADGPMPEAAVAKLAEGVLGALEALHGAGLVHRDVKPENIVVRDDGHAVLLDLGAATTRGGSTRPAKEKGHPGTPAYMAPEQAAGDDIDGRADLYALGAVLWEALAAAPAETRHDRLPDGWRALLERALAPEPDERWASAAEMRDALPDT